MYSIVLAEDHNLIIEGYKMLINKIDNLEIVATAFDGQQAMDAVEKHRPDFLILDLHMPKVNGLDALRYFSENFPDTKVIIISMFGDAANDLAMSSTKSAIGHLLGAAGAVEAIFSVMAMNSGEIPPTLNLDNPSEGIEGINLVPHEAQQKSGINAVLSNSFGFGGTNASIIIKSV